MDKREKIIKISADLFHQYGYNSVGLSTILNKAEVPKGSFYHYFKSKEDLLIEAGDLNRLWILRKVLAPMNVVDSMDFLLDKLRGCKTNEDFLKGMSN